jgi:hypothetical protein
MFLLDRDQLTQGTVFQDAVGACEHYLGAVRIFGGSAPFNDGRKMMAGRIGYGLFPAVAILLAVSFSASAISAINQRLDASLAPFAGRPLAEAFPYLILDARYERVREAGVITSQAVLQRRSQRGCS